MFSLSTAGASSSDCSRLPINKLLKHRIVLLPPATCTVEYIHYSNFTSYCICFLKEMSNAWNVPAFIVPFSCIRGHITVSLKFMTENGTQTVLKCNEFGKGATR